MTEIAIVGASGLVGRTFIQLLEKSNMPFDRIVLFGSENSEGMNIRIRGEEYAIERLTENIPDSIDIAFFSAGSAVSRAFIPLFASKGIICIDNSSAFRMDREIPLIVPEINMGILRKEQRIIANPNCSTIQLVLILHHLRQIYPLKRIDIVSCQSVSGAGRQALNLLHEEMDSRGADNVFYNNVVQHIGDIDESGYCFEEIKVMNETRKILDSPDLEISATTFRVPVDYCHTESVIVHFAKTIDMDRIYKSLQKSNMPIRFDYEVSNDKVAHTDAVFVSRVRKDSSRDNILHLTVTADNIHIGAATNAVKIAEEIL